MHCIDQSKTITSLLKYKSIDIEALSRVHVYPIEHVSYRQGPYRIRIDTADDRIVPVLMYIKQQHVVNKFLTSLQVVKQWDVRQWLSPVRAGLGREPHQVNINT